MTVPAKIEDFNANHFVVMKLVSTPVQHEVTDLNQSTLTEESWPALPTASGSDVETLSVTKNSWGRKKKLKTTKLSSPALHTTDSSADSIGTSDITNDASMCCEIQDYLTYMSSDQQLQVGNLSQMVSSLSRVLCKNFYILSVI